MREHIKAEHTDNDLHDLLAPLPAPQLVAAYNDLTGSSIKKFANRDTGLRRTLTAAQLHRDSLTTGRSQAVSASWADPDTRRQRCQRHAVLVDGVYYDSVRKAYIALDLPLAGHGRLRKQLVAEGVVHDAGGRHWALAEKKGKSDQWGKEHE